MRHKFRIAALLFAAAGIGAAAAPVPPVGPADPALGAAGAPITVIEYGSLTCGHCAAFEQTTLPRLKADWIEPGRIRFVFRDMPRDRTDLQAFQFVHCSSDQRFWAFLDSLYRSQQVWMPAPDPTEEFVRLGKLGGMPETKTRACLADETLAKASAASAQSGHDAGVEGTPSFFVNGRRVDPSSYEDWQKLLDEAGAQP